MHDVLHCNPKRRTTMSPQQIRALRWYIPGASYDKWANESEERSCDDMYGKQITICISVSDMHEWPLGHASSELWMISERSPIENPL
jgi:hypothetical protein